MKNESPSKWSIDEEQFRNWLNTREAEFEPALDPVPTLKALVFLALLDQREPCTYEELGRVFEKQKVVNGTIPVASLRVALSELGSILNRNEHRLQVRSFKDGQRAVKFELVPRNYNQNGFNKIIFINEPTEKSSEIAEFLLENQSLPFHSLYYLPRSACWWVTFSSQDAEARKHYEADTWERLKLKELVESAFDAGPASNAPTVVGVLGLATGEGLGEIELLRNILAEGHTVHYLAVDLSPVLLVTHIETIRESFEQELKDGHLLCAGVLVDVFSELDKAVAQARAKFVSSGVLLREDEFMPQDCPIIATYLGNCLGNDAPDRENTIFASICKGFPNNRPLVILVGVSVVREVDGTAVPDTYTRSFDEFLLQTPHHLLNNIGILRSIKPPESSDYYDEFTIPDEKPGEYLEERRSCRLRRSPDVDPKPYAASHGIEGHIYRFYYRLDFDLEMPKKRLRIPAGTEIALYTIIKYNMKTLIEGITKRRFQILYDDNYQLRLEVNDVVRQYAVFVAYLSGDEDSSSMKATGPLVMPG
jgi:hypothetical protein